MRNKVLKSKAYYGVGGLAAKHIMLLAEIGEEFLLQAPEYDLEAEIADEAVLTPATLPETTRVELDILYPQREGESASAYTSRVLSHAGEHGTNRQCSIGWHGECSERGLGEDAECNCLCHDDLADTYTVEGHAEGGVVTVTRAERGKQYWPAQDDEPATMWAWWVLARSETEAALKGTEKERNRLAELT
jgi:hypothetical protein